MNSLLIYNVNVPLSLKYKFEERLGDTVSFEISASDILSPGFTVDRKISDFLLGEELKQKEYDVIFIPYSLSDENYIEFLGLRMAFHIRLTRDFNNIQTPIVFYGLDDTLEINKLSILGQILFTKKIFQTRKISIAAFEKQITYINDSLIAEENSKDDFIKEFVKKTHIDPPGNYLTHHSIDNELALLKWSEYLGCDNKIPEVKYNLQTGLFFKHYMAEYPITKEESSKQFLIQGKANILLIDDESNKGWKTFFNHLFSLSREVSLESLNIDFKAKSKLEILEEAIKKINEFNPDVVLLDLRLSDNDFAEELSFSELSGIEILKRIKGVKKTQDIKEIKGINKGIQVIITTSSNKAWNFQTTLELGANGYIIKEGETEASEVIKKTRDLVINGIKRSKYLKSSFDTIKTLECHIQNLIENKKVHRNFGKELTKLSWLSIEMLNKSTTEDDFAYSYLALFKCLELISDEYVIKQDNTPWIIVGPENLIHYKWDSSSRSYLSQTPPDFRNGKPSVFERIAGIAFQKLSLDVSFVRQIFYSIKRRNEFIHPSEIELSKLDKQECLKIYNEKGFVELLKQLEIIIMKLL